MRSLTQTVDIRIAINILKFRAYSRQWFLVFAATMFVTLPCVTLTAIAEGFAQASGGPLDIASHPTSDSNILYWIAALAISSWSFFAKYMFDQLAAQRKTNADLVGQMFAYLESDHSESKTTIANNTAAFHENSRVLQEFQAAITKFKQQ